MMKLPTRPILNNGFNKPFCLDRYSSGRGILLYIWKDIPVKLIGAEKPPIEGSHVEINLRKQKWLTIYSYNLNKSMTVNK